MTMHELFNTIHVFSFFLWSCFVRFTPFIIHSACYGTMSSSSSSSLVFNTALFSQDWLLLLFVNCDIILFNQDWFYLKTIPCLNTFTLLYLSSWIFLTFLSSQFYQNYVCDCCMFYVCHACSGESVCSVALFAIIFSNCFRFPGLNKCQATSVTSTQCYNLCS